MNPSARFYSDPEPEIASSTELVTDDNVRCDKRPGYGSGYRRRGRRASYGNDPTYLMSRIARDRPDVLERALKGEFRSTRAAAKEAGIIPNVDPEAVRLNTLIDAWVASSLEDRQMFLWVLDEEIEAASDGRYLRTFPPRRGPGAYPCIEDKAIPQLEAAIAAGRSVTSLAQELGLSYRTLCRWRAGTAQPSAAALMKLAQL
jgi:hypothetical protein